VYWSRLSVGKDIRYGEQVSGKDDSPILLFLELIIYLDFVVAVVVVLCLLLS
jgi:hypothetical protein